MSRLTPSVRDFAQRVVAYESKGNKAKAKASAACPACERLRPHFSTLVGNAGFHALLSRALALAGADVRWLRTLRVNAAGSLEGFDKVHAQLHPAELLKGRVVLVAQLIGLLVAFIGEGLTMRLVREVWPKVQFDDLDAGQGRRK
jgi:hypothetical protein